MMSSSDLRVLTTLKNTSWNSKCMIHSEMRSFLALIQLHKLFDTKKLKKKSKLNIEWQYLVSHASIKCKVTGWPWTNRSKVIYLKVHVHRWITSGATLSYKWFYTKRSQWGIRDLTMCHPNTIYIPKQTSSTRSFESPHVNAILLILIN